MLTDNKKIMSLTVSRVLPRMFLLALVGTGLVGCTFAGHPDHQRPRGVDGFPCAGEPALLSVQQASLTTDHDLLQQARGISGQGGLCSANVWKLKRPMRLYRVWNQKDSDSQLGSWWLLERPTGLKDQYRFEYSVCTPPKELNHLISCEISAGSSIVLGSTQNNSCSDGPHPKTSMNQIYLSLTPSSKKHPVLQNCTDEGKWPAGRY